MKPLLWLLIAFCLLSCQKDEIPLPGLRISIDQITQIQRHYAFFQCTAFGDSILQKGIIGSFQEDLTLHAYEVIGLDSHGEGEFNVGLGGLLAGHTYYVRAFAATARDTVYSDLISFYSYFDECELLQNIYDQWYNTVEIGSQCWMMRNLLTTHYNNGDEIVGWLQPPDANHEMVYNRDINKTYYKHNVLMDERGVCPPGYHVPTFSDWEKVAEWLGGWDGAGGAMKAAGTTHWLAPNTSATNHSGFYARGFGYGVYNMVTDSFDYHEVYTEAHYAIADRPHQSIVLDYNAEKLELRDDPYPVMYKGCRCVKEQ